MQKFTLRFRPIRKEILSWVYNNSNYRSYHNNYHNSYYYRYYHHHLWRFEIFLDVSDWLVHQLAHNNLSLAVQLEIQAPKDANRKFKKQNKCKISKFYFQLLTHTKKRVNHKTFSWNHKWSKVNDVHKTARILTVSRQSHFPTETVSWNSH